MHHGFHQKEQDFDSNGVNCSFIICIRKSWNNTPLNYLINNFPIQYVNRDYYSKNKKWR